MQGREAAQETTLNIGTFQYQLYCKLRADPLFRHQPVLDTLCVLYWILLTVCRSARAGRMNERTNERDAMLASATNQTFFGRKKDETSTHRYCTPIYSKLINPDRLNQQLDRYDRLLHSQAFPMRDYRVD